MSEYPRDEFDDVSENSARQGVHRERLSRQRGSGLGLIILVAVLVLVIGVISALVFPRLGIGVQPSAGESQTSAPQTSSPNTTEPTTPETTTPTPEETIPPAEETQSPQAPAVDKTIPIAVYNATITQGLGTTVSGRLTQDGWTVNSVTNWPGNPLDTSYIFYPREDLAPTAQALATLLGIRQVLLDASFGDTIAVVAGPGYQG